MQVNFLFLGPNKRIEASIPSAVFVVPQEGRKKTLIFTNKGARSLAARARGCPTITISSHSGGLHLGPEVTNELLIIQGKRSFRNPPRVR